MRYHADILCERFGAFESCEVIAANSRLGIYLTAWMRFCWPQNIRQPAMLNAMYILRRVQLMSNTDKIYNHIDPYTVAMTIQELESEIKQ